jgi:hypothetical protein
MTQYKVLTGIDYPPDKRAEAGSIVSDLPEKSAKWLLDQGLIELADGKTNIATPVTPKPIAVEEPVVVEFDAEATDGDKDGFVQDGTEFERPVEETK